MSKYNHEESDTRVFVYVKYMLSNSHKDIFFQTVITDVVVIATSTIVIGNKTAMDTVWCWKRQAIAPIPKVFQKFSRYCCSCIHLHDVTVSAFHTIGV